MSEILYLNGDYVACAEAKISVFDRGFMFGDAVYELIPVYSGMLLHSKSHLLRLQQSLDAIGIPNPMDMAQWMEVFTTLINHRKDQSDSTIYIQVTRGTMAKRDHDWPSDMSPNVLVICSEQVHTAQDIQTRGERAVTLADIRWSECHIKTTNLLANTLLLQKAKSVGASEAILIRDNCAIEGTHSNLFIVKHSVIITPPKSSHMLGGITREIVLDICQQNNIICREQAIAQNELHDADEIWISSSSRQIVPIVSLDQHAVGTGKPGPMWLQVIRLYQQYILNAMRAAGV